MNEDRTITSATPKREDRRLAATYAISHRELTDRPQAPNETFREHEARLVGELARMAHLDRRRFVDWPQFEVGDRGATWGPYFDLRATVTARSL